MKDKLILITDKRSASEGEYIEIKWMCEACPDSLYLAFDSGYEKYSMAVADYGTTRIPMKRSNGKTIITLNALIGNKKVSKSVSVRIKNSKAKRPANRSGISKLKLWKEKLQAGWYVYRAQIKYWWLSRKKWQKALWIALLALWLGLLISSIVNKPQKQTAPIELQTAHLIR
jgi:hypothetical protein